MKASLNDRKTKKMLTKIINNLDVEDLCLLSRACNVRAHMLTCLETCSQINFGERGLEND